MLQIEERHNLTPEQELSLLREQIKRMRSIVLDRVPDITKIYNEAWTSGYQLGVTTQVDLIEERLSFWEKLKRLFKRY